MAEEQDDSQKTEEPTQRRIEEAIKKGQIAFSREVTSFLMLFSLVLIVSWFGPHIVRNFLQDFTYYIEYSNEIEVDSGSSIYLLKDIMMKAGAIMLLPMIITIVAALLSSFIQNGVVISSEPLLPKLEKVSPLKGLKRLFSMKSFVEFIKGIIKIAIIGIVSFIAVYPELHRLEHVPSYSMAGLIAFCATLAHRLLIGACIVMIVIAILDFLYQKYEYMKSLKMSKRDMKEEFKQSEGNPEIKSKLRSIRMQRAQKRMMAAVPNADVVITNPTHYSIALKYDSKTMVAPTCIAKGKDHIALKIREIAEEHDIPMVENKILARALFESVEVDEEVPVEHYKAVAEIIGYVYRLKGKTFA